VLHDSFHTSLWWYAWLLRSCLGDKACWESGRPCHHDQKSAKERKGKQRKNERVEGKQGQEHAAAAILAVSSAGGQRSTCRCAASAAAQPIWKGLQKWLI